MGYMTINNRRVAFTDEKNVLSVIRNQELIFLRSAIIRNCQHTAPVVCAWWKMTEGRFLHPAPKYQETEW